MRVVGGLPGGVEVLEAESQPEGEHQPGHEAQAEVPRLPGADRRPGWDGFLDDPYVAVLQPPGHPRLLETLHHRVVKLLVGFDLVLKVLALALPVVELLPLAPQVVDLAEQARLPGPGPLDLGPHGLYDPPK